jgi:hypothetical protein
MAALRLLKDDPVAAAWCRARKGYIAELKIKAVVALMRKLARALWHVARGASFDSSKLFDTRRLELSTKTTMTSSTAAPTLAREPCQGGAAIA